jgi:hypothetical protein
MNPTLAVDFATKHKSVRDLILADCDDYQRGVLVGELLKLFAHANSQLHTDLGRLGVLSALAQIADRDEHWARRHAAKCIIAFDQMRDVPEMDVALRELGAESLADLMFVAEALGRADEVVVAIPAVWSELLPECDDHLLAHFAEQLGDLLK